VARGPVPKLDKPSQDKVDRIGDGSIPVTGEGKALPNRTNLGKRKRPLLDDNEDTLSVEEGPSRLRERAIKKPNAIKKSDFKKTPQEGGIHGRYVQKRSSTPSKKMKKCLAGSWGKTCKIGGKKRFDKKVICLVAHSHLQTKNTPPTVRG